MPLTPPALILDLIERFERNLDSYRGPGYNETQLRREFIDPFFDALGWDVMNKAGHAEAYKDVVHEDAISVSGATKAPDYCFRIGGVRKFFLEAKKPAVNIKDAPDPAYQVRRYAWSAKLPLSILTDFEEFAVYDCRARPNRADKSGKGRILYLTHREYAARWDEIASVFSKEAVLRGSFDRFAVSERKRGTATVDAEFLAEIEGWREALARNVALRNPTLEVRDVNFAVQRTIDRLIFLRICEDRGVETYGQIQGLLNGENVYRRLQYIYGLADDRYNSGLFHFKPEKGRAEAPDDLTPALVIDDKVLKDIIGRLYYPESPYEFSVFPAEILGQVYEQFLGKVIRLTAGHRAVVEEKPEVKKAGGVYYTPAYIVEYIVKNTVGKLVGADLRVRPDKSGTDNKGAHIGAPLQCMAPKQISKLRILDPACGSGSFLIGAYEYLLNYHRDWYLSDGPPKHMNAIYQVAGGQWRLTTQERKRILLNNIYGVDIDSQAVEVTKLSLLLKVLEGENGDTLTRQLKMWRERALPDLGNNIKCGNSLIGPDYFSGQLLPDEDAMRRINPFDWHAEFPQIFPSRARKSTPSPSMGEGRGGGEGDGGFDAVIGNPPYVRQESLSAFKDYFTTHYEAFDAVADLYTCFMEQGVKLLRQGGRFSFIVSSSFLRATYGESLRRVLKKHGAVLRILDFGGLPVFENAKDTYVCIPLIAKTKQPARVEVSRIPSLKIRDLDNYATANHYTIPHQRLSQEAWALKSDEEAAVFEKAMKVGKPLGEYVGRKMFYGVKTGLNEAFEITEPQRAAILQGRQESEALIKPFLGGQDIRRYQIKDEGRHMIVIPSGWTRTVMKADKSAGQFSEREAWGWFSRQHPTIAKHLEPFGEACRKRQDQGEYWWELRPCDYYEYFNRPKIIFPDICKGPRFFLDRSGLYLANTAYCLGMDDPYLLGVLNSRLFWFAISNISIPFGIRAGQYRYRLIYQYMEKVPIRVINPHNKADKTTHEKIISHVEHMLDLRKGLAEATNPNDKTRLQPQIDTTDRQIDRLVYELYELTDEEIAIVEGGVETGEREWENEGHEDEGSQGNRRRRAERQAEAVAGTAQHPGEAGGGSPESGPGKSGRVDGVREPAGQYRTPEDAPEDPAEDAERLGSTRYFETPEGALSYAEISERLALSLADILGEIVKAPPVALEITPEWICLHHRKLAGGLFPDWAGRYRDVNVQVGSHIPPPFYEVPVLVRVFCDDLGERLKHVRPDEADVRSLAELLAWADWRFQWIHPFKDFNGRIGRVLLAAILYKVVLPHVETAPQAPESRNEYLAALRAADSGSLGLMADLWTRRIAEIIE